MKISLNNLSPNQRSVPLLQDLRPQIVDRAYLDAIGVDVATSQETLDGLISGSVQFRERLASGTLVPRPEVGLGEIDLETALEVHNYTGACPVLTYELNPVVGCNVGCLYCLVTDGVHVNRLTAYTNYHLLVRNILEAKVAEQHYYYFSPKTEAFQEPTLETGIAHNILREFIRHYEKHPASQARLFIASKAGVKQLQCRHEGDSILDLFTRLQGRMQFNTSVSIMPSHLRDALEPFAAPLDERLDAVRLCQDRSVMASSALVQPIVVPYLTDAIVHDFFRQLRDARIINFKPEFLTVCMANLAMIGQVLGYYDKDMERALYEYYVSPDNVTHRKQRSRTAPTRDSSTQYLAILMEIGRQYGMSISICHWVREQLRISEDTIPLINSNGFQCLGYQRRLFAS